jgi:hypothetical protein
LRSVVKSAAHALEAEDRHLAHCCKLRRWKLSEHGICTFWNERYYQYLIWSELMSSCRWRPVLEWNFFDLAFFDNEADTKTPAAVAEMKLWGSFGGSEELPRIRADINQLKVSTYPGMMLIFTAHLIDDAESNFCWLAKQLAIDQNELETASFPILTNYAGKWEFAVIGFLVMQGNSFDFAYTKQANGTTSKFVPGPAPLYPSDRDR